jgi:uncharacterized protein with GYD domain
MPIYIDLWRFTDQGLRNIKNLYSNARAEESRRVLETFGGRVIHSYAVMGEYDAVAITEFPSDEASKASGLVACSGGDRRLTTLRAFTMEELADMLKRLS